MSDREEQYVRAALAGAGLRPSEKEIADFVAAYPFLRQMADRMREVPEAKDEIPELLYIAQA